MNKTEQDIRNEIEEVKDWKYWSLNKKRYFVINSEMMNEEIINKFKDDEFESLFDKGVEVKIEGLNNKLSGFLLAQSEKQEQVKRFIAELKFNVQNVPDGRTDGLVNIFDVLKVICKTKDEIFKDDGQKEGVK